MKADAAANADSDKQAKERAEKINMADSLIFQTEKQMKDIGDKIHGDKKSAIESALADLKEAHKMQDIAKIDSASERMNAAWQAASQDIYQAQQQTGDPGTNGQDFNAGQSQQNSGNRTDEVTDVEFEEVGDKK